MKTHETDWILVSDVLHRMSLGEVNAPDLERMALAAGARAARLAANGVRAAPVDRLPQGIWVLWLVGSMFLGGVLATAAWVVAAALGLRI